MAFLLQSSPK